MVLAECIIIGKDFIQNDDVCLILGDNLFFNSSVIKDGKLNKSSKIFVKKVKNANRYGVLEEIKNKPILIHEKPLKYISDNAVLGMYMYKNNVIDIVKKLKPSKRGELEITDLNNIYINENECDVVYMEEKSIWFDSGTFESLFDASEYVKKNYNT